MACLVGEHPARIGPMAFGVVSARVHAGLATSHSGRLANALDSRRHAAGTAPNFGPMFHEPLSSPIPAGIAVL